MTNKYIIIRYGEIWLKGRKRPLFEKLLLDSIIKMLDVYKREYNSITSKGGRILIETNEECPELSNVHGICSFSSAISCENDLDSIKRTIEETYLKRIKEPFCVRVKRLDKVGNLTSTEIENLIGEFIVEKTNKKVNLKKPSTKLGIEIFSKNAYIFDEVNNGIGGLPITHEGKVLLILETGKDLVAGKLLIKRGCVPEIIVWDKSLLAKIESAYPTIKFKVYTKAVNEISPGLYDFVASGEERELNFPNVLFPLECLSKEELSLLLGESDENLY